MNQKNFQYRNKPHTQYSSNINTGQFSGYNMSISCSFYKLSTEQQHREFKTRGRANNRAKGLVTGSFVTQLKV